MGESEKLTWSSPGDLHVHDHQRAALEPAASAVHRHAQHLRGPRAPQPHVQLDCARHVADSHRDPVEHPWVLAVLPLLVLDRRLPDVARWLHVLHDRLLVPALLHDHWPGRRCDVAER